MAFGLCVAFFRGRAAGVLPVPRRDDALDPTVPSPTLFSVDIGRRDLGGISDDRS